MLIMSRVGYPGWLRRLVSVALVLVLLMAGLTHRASAHGSGATTDETDPARNVPLPCENVPSPGSPGRAARNIVHLANVCGLVGTDVEFQSRKDLSGKAHDYAFVGTMGAGIRVFDVTDPVHPVRAGGYVDAGWENDIQVRGNIAVATFDGVAGEDSTASTCLKTRYPNASGQGVDIYYLNFNPNTARFDLSLLTCVANPPGGAHNATLSPTGQWLAISDCCSDWAIDVIDLRNVEQGETRHAYRLIDASRKDAAGRCPPGASFECVVMERPDGSSASGLWRPHDVFFSARGNTMYVAALNSTFIVDVSQVLSGQVRTISVIPNVSEPADGDATTNIQLSHQADVTPDGRILIISDEKGGGLSNSNCNTSAGEPIIGALHFYALAPMRGIPRSVGASPANPKRLGIYINPQPLVGPDPLAPAISTLPRSERGCTVHVFRIGGNGSSSAGPAAPGYDGVSSLGKRQLVTAWYGAGVWYVDFSTGPDVRAADTTREDPQTTWGNTLGWNVQAGADTWSAKEYKGHIYTGDIVRGFDVYGFAACEGLACGTTTAQAPAVRGIPEPNGELGTPLRGLLRRYGPMCLE